MQDRLLRLRLGRRTLRFVFSFDGSQLLLFLGGKPVPSERGGALRFPYPFNPTIQRLIPPFSRCIAVYHTVNLHFFQVFF